MQPSECSTLQVLLVKTKGLLVFETAGQPETVPDAARRRLARRALDMVPSRMQPIAYSDIGGKIIKRVQGVYGSQAPMLLVIPDAKTELGDSAKSLKKPCSVCVQLETEEYRF